MAKYVVQFSKEGYICYTSHLDMMRLFKRIFKKCGISLVYSQGFNPHPKMSFAQPLSLGYSSVCEYLEFETKEVYSPLELKEQLAKQMPEGINIILCKDILDDGKTLAAKTIAAEYLVGIPLGEKQLAEDANTLCEKFLNQKEIIVKKKKKKSKTFVDVNIRGQIQEMNFVLFNQTLIVTALLDSGSASNLSPELLITAISDFLELETERSDISVMRSKIIFKK